jgi:hypothetical protein
VLGVKGQVRVQGPCDFAVYNYGTRDNDQIKATYSYASAAAASFGSLSNAKPPRMVMDSTCTQFNLKFYNTSADARGPGEIYLLENGMEYNGQKYTSTNVKFEYTPFTFESDTIFAKVTVLDPFQDAKAYLYVSNRAGKDTMYTFTYNRTHVSVTPGTQAVNGVTVFQSGCQDYTFTNLGKNSIEITGVSLKYSRTPFSVSALGLPKTLKPNESMIITGCFTAPDTMKNVHWDSIQIQTACFTADIARIEGYGRVPTIFADDQDYKIVDVGETKCEDIEIKNLSPDKELILTKDILKSDDEFKIADKDLARFPITLAPAGKPGDRIVISICYTPLDEGFDTAFVVWGRDIPEPYSENNRKEWSILTGQAQKPGVSISSAVDSIVCVDVRTLVAELKNTGTGNTTIQPLALEGADAVAGEFTIESVENMAPNGWTQSFELAVTEAKDVKIKFTPNMSDPNPWRIHRAMLVIHSNDWDTAFFAVDMRTPNLTADPLVNLGTTGVNEVLTSSITLKNTGNYEFKVKNFGFRTGGIFTVVDGIAIGDVIQPDETRIVNISATSAAAGAFADKFFVESETCGEPETNVAGLFKNYEVTASGADIPATWTCREDNSYSVSFTNNSTDDVKLKAVEMLSGAPGALNAMQISFGTPDVGTVVNGGIITFPGGEIFVKENETVTFPVNFASSIVGNAFVQVQFTYADKDGTKTLERDIRAIGKNYPVDLTVTGNAYRGTNDVELQVPIEVSQTNLYDAEVYGYEFDLTFNEDNFTIRDVQQGNGHLTPTYSEVGKTTVDGVDYTTVRVRAHDGSRIQNNENILARLILATRLTTEDATTFVPSNFKFLDQSGQAVCWTPKTETGNQYTYDPLCGDKSLQQYLKNGIAFLQNNSMAPNPTNSTSTYEFDLHANNVLVSVGIYDALGNQVATVLSEKSLDAGHHKLNIDVTTLPAGTYYVRTNAGEGWVATQKLTVKK